MLNYQVAESLVSGVGWTIASLATTMPAPNVKHHFSLLCEYALFDRENRPSIIGVVTNVQVPQIPGAVVSLYFVASFKAPAGSKFGLELVGPDRKVIARAEEREIVKPVSGPGPSPYLQTSTTTMMEAKPALFHAEGIHYLVLRVDGRVVHREPFAVFVTPS